MQKHIFRIVILALTICLFWTSCSKETTERNASALTTAPSASLEDRGSCGWQEVERTGIRLDEFGNQETYTYKVWVFKPCTVYSTLVGGAGGGWLPTDIFQPTPYFQVFPQNPDLQNVNDITAFIDCMRPADVYTSVDEYEVGIYVEQPVPDFPYAYQYFPSSAQVNLGQSYLYLRKKDVPDPSSLDQVEKEVLLAYLPTQEILGNTTPYIMSGSAKISSPNGAFPCNVACKQRVSWLNYKRTLNKVRDYLTLHPEYHIHNSNSVDFVLSVTQALGFDLTPAKGEYPDQIQANCSGVLGEKIRAIPPGGDLVVSYPDFIPVLSENCL